MSVSAGLGLLLVLVFGLCKQEKELLFLYLRIICIQCKNGLNNKFHIFDHKFRHISREYVFFCYSIFCILRS